MEWVRRLGAVPEDCLPTLVIAQDQGRQYTAHLSVYRSGGSYDRVIDHAADRIVSDPLVVPIEAGSWPKCLDRVRVRSREGGAWHLPEPEQTDGTESV